VIQPSPLGRCARPAAPWALAVALLVAAAPARAAAQGEPAPRPRPAAPARPYAMSVKAQNGVVTVTLKADNASVTEVAAELGRRLKVHATVGPNLKDQIVTTDITDAPLETALTSIAPRAMVDYEIRRDTPLVVRALHLLAADDPTPRVVTDEGGGPVGLMIEGNTEDSTTPGADLPLRVFGDRDSLTVVARAQRLTAVAAAIAEVISVQVQLSVDPPDIVDADLRNVSAEEAVTRLSDKLRLIVRVDVNQGERRPVRLVIAGANSR
jgi:hypothetical protein